MSFFYFLAMLGIARHIADFEKWLGGAVEAGDDDAVEDWFFRGGLRTLVRGSAALAAAAGLAGLWRAIDALPQPRPEVFTDLPPWLALAVAVLGGGRMAIGLMIVSWRSHKRRPMGLGRALILLVMFGGGAALISSVPFFIVHVAGFFYRYV